MSNSIERIKKFKRPIIPIEIFESACINADLTSTEQKLIDYIRFIGIFTQPILMKGLGMKSKPPVLTLICEICRKIGNEMPSHFNQVQEWSKEINDHNVKWDGNLICSMGYNIDGETLSPESGTAQFHTFIVHKELFQGLE